MWCFHDSAFCHLRLCTSRQVLSCFLMGSLEFVCFWFLFACLFLSGNLSSFIAIVKAQQEDFLEVSLGKVWGKNRHLIGLKKISPVLQLGQSKHYCSILQGTFQSSSSPFMYIYVFALKRMKLRFSKVAGMDIYKYLRNTKLLGFSEGRVGWDGVGWANLGSASG